MSAMRVLVLNGSARPMGGTKAMADALARGAREVGHMVDVVDVARMDIHGCLGCDWCRTKGDGACVQRDDMDRIYPLWDAADVIVLASPVYYGSFCGQLHCLIHRSYAGDKPKSCKATALLLCSGSKGVYGAAERIYHGFIQGYYKVRDLGVVEATTEEATSEEMAERLAEFGRSIGLDVMGEIDGQK